MSTLSRSRPTSRRAYLPRGGGEATKLYDRTNDAISLDEIERILI
jgi:hypothetical protein